MRKILLLLILTIILAGCTRYDVNLDNVEYKTVDAPINEIKTPNNPTPEIKTIDEPAEIESAPEIISPPINDQLPTISTRISPSNPNLGEIVELTVSSEDDRGIKQISFNAANGFVDSTTSSIFDCSLQKSCANTWKLTTAEEGMHEIIIAVVDSSEQLKITNVKVDVRPAIKVISKCGNTLCDNNETTTSCPADCKQETETKAATETPTEDPPCTSNAACGYKKACQGGKCVSVQCTTDAQCTGCKRCSSYRCVRCGYGASGYCTC